MAEQRRRLVRLAVLEELRASYGIKVKSGSCLEAAKQAGAVAAEVRGAVLAGTHALLGPGGGGAAGSGAVAAVTEQCTQGRELLRPGEAGQSPVPASVRLP